MRTKLKSALAVLALWALVPAMAWAFPLTVQLTGDPRPGNPDGIIIDVTIDLIDPTTVEWTIDLNSPLHPDAFLGEFYFNVLTPTGGTYSFDGFDPSIWGVITPASPVGGGSITFTYEANHSNPNTPRVDNDTDLVFLMHLNGGPTFTDDLFLGAPDACSTDVALGCGQVGAHVQGLTPAPNSDESTSGFTLGNYVEPSPRPIPEPGTLSLLGAMLLSLGLLRLGRRRT
jgi:hypothetical protein